MFGARGILLARSGQEDPFFSHQGLEQQRGEDDVPPAGRMDGGPRRPSEAHHPSRS